MIEADEYDTAFFDKRSKFVHYRPRTAILNNLEYDHADIFPDLAAIETQFHHLVRTVPPSGRLIVNGEEASLARVLARGCWSEVERFAGAEFVARDDAPSPELANRERRQHHAARRAAGNAALAARSPAARPAQSIERTRGARRGAPCGRGDRSRYRRARRVPRHQAPSRSGAAPQAASRFTTISRITRRRSRRRSTGCGAKWGARGSSRCWSREPTR